MFLNRNFIRQQIDYEYLHVFVIFNCIAMPQNNCFTMSFDHTALQTFFTKQVQKKNCVIPVIYDGVVILRSRCVMFRRRFYIQHSFNINDFFFTWRKREPADPQQQRQTINQDLYMEVLKRLREILGSEGLTFGTQVFSVMMTHRLRLQHRLTLSVRQFLIKNRMMRRLFNLPPYSPMWTPRLLFGPQTQVHIGQCRVL